MFRHNYQSCFLIRWMAIPAMALLWTSCHPIFAATGSPARQTPGSSLTQRPSTRPASPVSALPDYSTPRQTVRSLAAAIKRGNMRGILASVLVPKDQTAALAAVACYLVATQNLMHTAFHKLGRPPGGSGLPAHSLDREMDKLVQALPQATLLMVGNRATIQFAATPHQQRKSLHLTKAGNRWRIDGNKLLHLDAAALSPQAMKKHERQLNNFAQAMAEASADIISGKVKTWANLEKDLYTRALEISAESSARDHARIDKAAH